MAADVELMAAQEQSTSSERLVELSRHRLITVRMAVAANSSTPSVVLAEMSSDTSPRIREQVALNTSLDDATVLALAADLKREVRRAAAINARGRDQVVEALSRSTDPEVREYIAWHNSVSPLDHDVQARLATDSEWQVRQQIAETTNYRALFDRLLEDPNPRVRGSCAGNPRATRSDIERLIADRSAVVRSMTVALGVVYPDDEQLLRLARDKSANTQWAVIMRVDTPREALEIVANEGDEMNRTQARASLAGRSYGSEFAEHCREARANALLLDPLV